jgi:hypothetical protein
VYLFLSIVSVPGSINKLPQKEPAVTLVWSERGKLYHAIMIVLQLEMFPDEAQHCINLAV